MEDTELKKQDKKKYWLKLEKGFLDSKYIKIIKGMPNGNNYILFYLALMLESIDTVGHLRFTELVPYNEQMLASLTDTNIDIVRSAMKLFTELGMITILSDGTIFIPEVPLITGKESDSAERVRAFRQRKKGLQLNDDETKCNNNKEKDEKEQIKYNNNKKEHIEENISKNKRTDEQAIIDSYNSICKSLPKVTKLTEKRRKAIKAVSKEYLLEEILRAFSMAEQSDFLKGINGSWNASFDFIMTINNITKILEGNYANKGGKQSYQDIPDELRAKGVFSMSGGKYYTERGTEIDPYDESEIPF